MTEHDPIAHLDFSTPELTGHSELERFESLEDSRIKILSAFFDHLHDLKVEHGGVGYDDPEKYVDRLRQLEALMMGEMADFGLNTGDFIQANVPNMIYPAGFVARFDAGAAVRARFDGLVIYPHYDIAADGEFSQLLPFGLNLSVSQAMTVAPEGMEDVEGLDGTNPLISLHHDMADLHRVILPTE